MLNYLAGGSLCANNANLKSCQYQKGRSSNGAAFLC